MGEDKIARFDSLMAGEAALKHRFAGRQTFVELCEPPTARGGIFFGFLDHELNSVRRRARHERLAPAKDIIVFLRRDITPS